MVVTCRPTRRSVRRPRRAPVRRGGGAVLRLGARSADEVTGHWEALTAEGSGTTIVVPLAPAGWAPLYGMATDRFGVTWVLDVAVLHEG